MPVTFYQSARSNTPNVLNPAKLFYIIYKVSFSTSKRTHRTSLEWPTSDYRKNKRPLLWQSYQVHKYAVCTKCSVQCSTWTNVHWPLGFKGLHKDKKVSAEVLNVVTTVNIVLWRVASCSLLAKHQRFKGTYRLPLTRQTEAAHSTKHNVFKCLHQLLVYFFSL